MQLAPIHVVVSNHTTARGVRDLASLRVGVGLPKSSTQIEADSLLDAYRVDRSRMRLEPLEFQEASAWLSTGRLDAFFVIATYPVESVRCAAAEGEVASVLRSRGRGAADKVRVPQSNRDSWQPPTLVRTRRFAPLVCETCSSAGEIDQTLVYQLTRRFIEVLPSAFCRESLRLVDLQQVMATPISLHPGAARYYRERELER